MRLVAFMLSTFPNTGWRGSAVVLLLLSLSLPAWAGEEGRNFPLPPIEVVEGFEVELVADSSLVSYPMLGGFDWEGRLYLCASAGQNMDAEQLLEQLPNHVQILHDTDGNGRFDRSTTFADRMTFPQGVMLHDGAFYCASPPHIWRMEDRNGDGVADHREKWISEFRFMGHAGSIHGPFLGPAGRIYWTDAPLGHEIRDKAGRLLSKGRAARIFSCRPDGSQLETYCGGGMYNPIDIAFTPEGDMLGIMTWYNPDEARRDALVHYVYGGVYPKRVEAWFAEFKRTGPPMPAMIIYGVVAPSGIVRYRGNHFGDDYQGNYFISYFNTRKVDRVRIEADGSTYRAVAEPFLSSTSPDFHPTDVIEDADGSLLVIDTGGWFAGRGCPTSKISRPQLHGAIYRIRRSGGPVVQDPRGLKINWKDASIELLASLINDDRPTVRDRAVEQLAAQGEKAVDALAAVAHKSSEADHRRRVVWALGRIGGPSALKVVRRALADSDSRVQLAAVNCVATLRDRHAETSLRRLLADEDLRVRRAAATALGRIGNVAAVDALLAALDSDADRILEHAVIFALIEIDDPQATLAGLGHGLARVRQAALIALDQMDHGDLSQPLVTPLLETDDEQLQRTVLAITSRRGWSQQTFGLLETWLEAEDLSRQRRDALRGALRAMESDPKIQQLIGRILTDPNASLPARVLLLNVVAASELETLPDDWHRAVSVALGSPKSELVHPAIHATGRLGAQKHGESLLAVARDGQRSVSLRLAAATVAAPQQHPLPGDLFAQLLAAVIGEGSATDQLAAAHALAAAHLRGGQLAELAAALSKAGPLVLRTLVGAFEGKPEPALAMKVIDALGRNPTLASLPSGQLRRFIAPYPLQVQAAGRALLDRLETNSTDLTGRIEQLAASLDDGDAARGRAVFFGSNASCHACHRVNGEGGTIGPDLSGIGQVRTRRNLLEAIAFPSATFARGYEPYNVATVSGELLWGVLGRRTTDAIYLRTTGQQQIRIARDQIEQLVPSTVSTMPDGLADVLSARQLSDLISFLKSMEEIP